MGLIGLKCVNTLPEGFSRFSVSRSVWTAASIPTPAAGEHRSIPGFHTAAGVALHVMACNDGGDLMGVVEKAHVTF